MLNLGVTEPLESPWRSPHFGSQTTWLCLILCRGLNEVSTFDIYPALQFNTLIPIVGGARYLSAIDPHKGLLANPTSPSSLHQFTKLPFGLHGAAASFQK